MSYGTSQPVYAAVAECYLAGGWTTVFPLPPHSKEPPPVGYSGNNAPDTSADKVADWVKRCPDHNVGLRMPLGVVGIDVDHYDKTTKDGRVIHKRGADTLAELEQRWGKLPDTWRSSAREAPSGIRYFRVPEGLHFAAGLGGAGGAIDVIQRGHRYMVAAPSIHPETGLPYHWWRPNGSLADPLEIPLVEGLPRMPELWVAGMTENIRQHRPEAGSEDQAQELLAAIESDEHELCERMARATAQAVAEIQLSGSGSRHDTAMTRTMHLIGLAAEGHHGGAEALEQAKEVWEEVTAGEDRGDEWDSLVTGAAALAVGETGQAQPKELDPCTGGAGLGIVPLRPLGDYQSPDADIDEIENPEPQSTPLPDAPQEPSIGVQVSEGAEGARCDTTLIVEGGDNAAALAPLVGTNTRILTIAGRESWRDKGIPMPAVRSVKDTQVIILFGPEVISDLATYNSALALKEACEGFGAQAAVFTQPPGSEGARVAEYLAAQLAEDRLGLVRRMLSQVSTKPATTKPKMKRAFTGQDPLQELELNDMALGTGWGDEHRDQFRWVAEDRNWLVYKQGRWTPKGAETHVNASVMEYVAEVGAPLLIAQHTSKVSDPDRADAYRNAYNALVSHNKRTSVRNTAAAYSPLHVSDEDLDSHPSIWCAANASINLRTLEVLRHDPGLLLTMGSPVAYDPNAECPRFDAFLTEALPDSDVREYVLRLFAMAMHGQVYEHIFPVFVGTGRNGKGTLLRAMNAIFGELGVVIDPRSLLVTKFEQHNEEIAQLHKKRLATTEEPTKGAQWNAARIKSWTGGDALKGSFKGHKLFEFKPSHTLIMASNDKPEVDLGEESSFWPRYREIPFKVSFEGRIDTTLEPHIHKHELPGVLNRLLEAADRYNRYGLDHEPAEVAITTKATRNESNYLKSFAEEYLNWVGKRSEYAVISDVYTAASKWWADNGIDQKMPPLNRGKFREALGAALEVDLSDPTIDGRLSSPKRERVWFGLRLEAPTSNQPVSGRLLVALSQTKDLSNQTTTDSALGQPKSDQKPTSNDQKQRSNPSYWSEVKPQVTESHVPVRPERPVKSYYVEDDVSETHKKPMDHEKDTCVSRGSEPHSEFLVFLVGDDPKRASDTPGSEQSDGSSEPAVSAQAGARHRVASDLVTESSSDVVVSSSETLRCGSCDRVIRRGALCGKCAMKR